VAASPGRLASGQGKLGDAWRAFLADFGLPPEPGTETGCRNSHKTQEFYSRMFDWKPQPMGPAAMIAAETGGPISALGHEPHPYTIFFVEVDDVAAYLKKAESKAKPSSRLCTFTWMQDPEGNTVGLSPKPQS